MNDKNKTTHYEYKEKFSFKYIPQKDVEIINVIKTRLTERGEGTKKDPIRIIEQYWSMDGDLLWEKDTMKEGGSDELS